jgi:hypothetical protein
VTASASTAPLAFTPPGALVTSIAGLADERRGDGLAGAGVRAAGAAVRVTAGRGLWAAAVDPHAATAPIPKATMVSEAIRALSRTEPVLFRSGEMPSANAASY